MTAAGVTTGHGIQQTVSSAANSSLNSVIAGWYIVEVDVELVEGSFLGSGVLWRGLSATNGTLSDASVSFVTEFGVGTPGQTYSLRKRVQFTNANVVRGQIFLMSQWSSFGAATAKTINVYRCSVRPASDAEATVTTLQGAVSTVQGKTSAYLEQITSAGTASAIVALRADGATGSTINLQAQSIIISNANGSNATPVMAIENGNATFFGKLRANAITSTELATNSVVSSKIASDAVTSNTIASNAVTAVKIASNSITADKIAANSITARELSLADLTNLAPGGDLADLTQFSANSRVTVVADASNGYAGKPNVVVVDSGSQSWLQHANSSFAVEAGDQVYLEFAGKASAGAAGSFSVQIRWNTATGAQAGTSTVAMPITTTAYGKFSNSFAAPAGAVTGLIQYSCGNTTGTVYIGQVRLLRKNAGNLIVDGSITTNHMAANSIAGDRIAANSLNANKLVAGSITTTQMTANSIDGSVITAGTIDAVKIKASTVLAGSVLVGSTALSTVVSQSADPAARINAASTTIDPGKITISGATTLANWRNASDTTKIEGGSIATNTITANSIAANAITASKMTLMSLDDINPDAGMADRNFWAWGTEGTISAMDGSGAAQPRRFAQVTNTAGRNVDVTGQPIAMEVGATYKITFRVWLSSDFAGWLGCTMHMPGQQWHTPAPNTTNSAVDSGGYPLIQSGNLNGVPKNQWVEYTSQFTFQANATGAFTQFRTRYALTAGSAQFAWQVSRAMDAKLVVDGAITANKIAAGSISTEKLSVGFGGNMIHGAGLNVNPNSFMNIDDDRSGLDFEKNGRGEWLLGSEQYAFGIGFNSNGYNLPDKSVWSLHQVNNYAGGSGYSDLYFTRPMNATGGAAREFDVEQGRTYEFSIYTGAHRCNGMIYMQILDGAWGHIEWTAQTAETSNLQQAGGGTNLGDFRRLFVRKTMPSNARFVRLMVRKYRTISGNSDSYLFMAKPVFAETSPNATKLMNWSPPSQSIIDGAGIRTGTITADRMSVGSLDAITANIGTLRTASSGQRVEISSNVIKVYDASNVLRVRLGDLNG